MSINQAILVARLFVKLEINWAMVRGPDPTAVRPFESFVDCEKQGT